jgi:hypothetical protein|tara:strand:- start:136 stop:249 length:114 start_codon:yes stop_codon:yes gene_type:complete
LIKEAEDERLRQEEIERERLEKERIAAELEDKRLAEE